MQQEQSIDATGAIDRWQGSDGSIYQSQEKLPIDGREAMDPCDGDGEAGKGSSEQARKEADEARVDVGSGLRVIGLAPGIVKLIVGVWATDNGARVNVGVGAVAVEVVAKSLAARYMIRILVNGHYGGSSVMHLRRVPVPESHHVRHSLRIIAQNVIHLRTSHNHNQNQVVNDRVSVE